MTFRSGFGSKACAVYARSRTFWRSLRCRYLSLKFTTRHLTQLAQPIRNNLGSGPRLWSSRLTMKQPACRSDSGSASFLGEVWAAMQEWRDGRAWQPVSVPSLDLQHYEATLAVAGPAELRPPALPDRPPLVPENASPAEVSSSVVDTAGQGSLCRLSHCDLGDCKWTPPTQHPEPFCSTCHTSEYP